MFVSWLPTKNSNTSCTLVGNEIVDHWHVVAASPVGAAPTTSSFSTWTHGFNGLDKDNIYIYIIVEKSPNSSHMYDHGFMDNTNRQAVKNWLDSQTRDASLTSWRQPFCKSTIIAIIRACACWALFVVTLTNTVHLIYIYIYIWRHSNQTIYNMLQNCNQALNSLWPTWVWVNIGSANGLKPDGTNPLPQTNTELSPIYIYIYIYAHIQAMIQSDKCPVATCRLS